MTKKALVSVAGEDDEDSGVEDMSRGVRTYRADSEAARSVQKAAEGAADWARLEVPACAEIYRESYGLSMYGDVVIVVDGMGSADDGSGWTRDEVWDLPAAEAAAWDALVEAYERDPKNAVDPYVRTTEGAYIL